ncbi:MAG TPA: Crp/Fnr family transcriptional regulator [Rhizomicrobium sp.]|jgi:CRP-like cAMP-binding protein|nr:Crp/Fnr family transcriptional regulator [Rhizomicrobium sp.]
MQFVRGAEENGSFEPRPIRIETQRHAVLTVRSLSRFGGLSEVEETLVRAATAQSHAAPPGTELVAEGWPLDKARILLSGWAARVRFLSDGRRQILSFLVPGDVFGTAARPGALAPWSTVALTAVTTAQLPLLDEASDAPAGLAGLGSILWQMMQRDEERLVNQIVRIGRQSAYERVAHLFLELYFRIRALDGHHGVSFRLPLTQEVLSDALGLSVVHTNRTLQQLRRDGLIELKSGAVSILDIPRLARIGDYRLPETLVPSEARHDRLGTS